MVHAEVIFDISGTLKVGVACDEVPTIPDMQVHRGAGTSPESAPWENRAVPDSPLHSPPPTLLYALLVLQLLLEGRVVPWVMIPHQKPCTLSFCTLT